MKKLVITSTSSQNNPYEVSIEIDPDWQNYWLKDEFNVPFYQNLTDNVVNIPYVDVRHDRIEINGVIIYRLNHDAGHALRQVMISQFLLKMVGLIGLQDNINEVETLSSEERAAIMLAAFLFRAGRTNEIPGIKDPSNVKRSALLFTQIAKAVGFNSALVDDIAYFIDHRSYSKTTLIPLNKAKLIKAILDLSHHSDLVRCWPNLEKINKENLENLSNLIDAEYVQSSNTILLNFVRACNLKTGSPNFKHDETNDKLIPPVSLRKKTVSQIGDVFNELSPVMTQFFSYVKTKDIAASKQALITIDHDINQESSQDKAANAIKRAFRIRRAHKVTEQAVGINPAKVSEQNLLLLKNELRLGQALSADDKQRLKDSVLLPEEEVVYEYLVKKFNWVLKHITLSLPAVRANGNSLKSLHQRNRESRANDVRYTSDFEGRTDNIYFTISSANGWPAEFLQMSNGHEIRIPLRDFVNESGQLADKLSGLWVSSAWFEFLGSTVLKTTVDGVTRKIVYQKADPTQRFINAGDDKEYVWQYPDGTEYRRKVTFDQETVTGKELLPFLALNVLLELRHSQEAFRKECLANPASPVLEAFVDAIYEQRSFEALTPATIPLNDKRIEVRPFNQFMDGEQHNFLAMRNAIDLGDVNKIDQMLKQGFPINCQLVIGLTPLGYCLLNLHTKNRLNREFYSSAAAYFINSGANVQAPVHQVTTLAAAIQLREYPIVEAILKRGIFDKRTDRIKRYINVNKDLQAVLNAVKNRDVMMLDLLIKYGLKFSTISSDPLILISEMDEYSGLKILKIITAGGISCNSEKQREQAIIFTALENCIKRQKYQLLEKMLQAGCSPNVKGSLGKSSLLSYAKKLPDQRAVQILLQFKAQDRAVADKKIHLHLLVTNKEGHLLLVKVRRKDSSLSSFWQTLGYYDSELSEHNIKIHVFSAVGLRPKQSQLQLVAQWEDEQQIEQVYEFKILDENLKAIDTEEFACPVWLTPGAHTELPISYLAKIYLQKQSQEIIKKSLTHKNLLLTAIDAENLPQVQKILNLGVIDDEQAALLNACDRKLTHSPILNALFDAGYDVNTVHMIDNEFMSPLMYAILHHNLTLIELLIKRNANLNQSVGSDQITPLMMAAHLNAIDILELLKEHGADYKHPANKGVLPYALLRRCSNKTFDYLVEYAELNGLYQEFTAINVAIERDNTHQMRKLMAKKVDLSIRHPILNEPPERIYRGNDDVIQKYFSEGYIKPNSWYPLQRDFRTYIDYSGASKRGRVDEELAREYTLSMLNESDHPGMVKLFHDIFKQCGIQDPKQMPQVAIAHEGQDYIQTCAGFSSPVIAIHRDFFLNKKLDARHLTFAIAHELVLLKENGDHQFNIFNDLKRIEADYHALKVIKNRSVAFEFLQAQASFHERFSYLDDHEQPKYFSWPWLAYKGSVMHNFRQLFPDARLKGLKVYNLDYKDDTQFVLEYQITPELRSTVLHLKFYDYFSDFPEKAPLNDKFTYFNEHLSDLNEEFLPYVLCQIASQKVRQFCDLLEKHQLNNDMLDSLLRRTIDLKVHSFSYIYKRAFSFSTTAQPHQTSEKLKPLAYFKDLVIAIKNFINQGENIGTLEQARQYAKQMVELFPYVKYQSYDTHFNDRIIDSYVTENNGQLPLQSQLHLESNICYWIKWPQLKDIKPFIQYALQDKEGYIWQALWMLDYADEPALYDAIPSSFLTIVSKSQNIYEQEKSGAVVWPIKPLLRSRQNWFTYPSSLGEIINNYKEKNSTLDVTMLKGNFIREFDEFFAKNKAHLCNNTSPLHVDATQIFTAQLQKLLDGTPSEQEFVFQFFNDYKLYKSNFARLGNSLQNPYIQFALKNKKKSNPARWASIFKGEISSNDLMEFYTQLFEFNTLYEDDLTRLLACTDYAMSSENISAIVHLMWKTHYFSKHSNIVLNAQIIRVIEFLNAKKLCNMFLQHVKIQKGELEQLPTFDCIILYRCMDRDMLFHDLTLREALANRILTGLSQMLDVEQKIDFLEQLIFVKQSLSDFAITDRSYLNQLNKLLAQCYADKYGKDDGSKAYFQKTEKLLQRVKNNTLNHDAREIFRLLAELIVSQELISQNMGNLVDPQTTDNRSNNNSNHYSDLMATLSLIGQQQSDKEEVMRFISSPLSAKSLSRFSRCIMRHPRINEIKTKLRVNSNSSERDQIEFATKNLYQFFWDLKLYERAGILDGLIITAKDEADPRIIAQSYEFGFNFIVQRLFPNKDRNDRESFAFELLKSYLATADHFERQFLLAALFVTSNESNGQAETVGRKLALLCEHMGPAYVKLAQAIHSHPDTPQDIKNDLSHVKGRANPPDRWQIWRLIKVTLPADVFTKIKRVGKLLGSASYNLALECHYDNQSEMVVTLLRKNAAHDAEKGFNHLRRTVQHCHHVMILPAKATFGHMIDEAQTLSLCEIDNNVANKQYQFAKMIYAKTNFEIKVEQKKYRIQFEACENVRNGPGFKILTKMPGEEYNDLKDLDVKKAIASAVVTKELKVLLSGGVFDSDRHGSQYRVTVNGGNIHLGLYDFGEMSLEALNAEEIKSYAELVKELPITLKNGGSISDLFQTHIQNAVNEHKPYRHLMRVHKAILALNDFRQYLSNDDLLRIVKSIRSEMHPVLKEALTKGYLETSSVLELGISFFNEVRQQAVNSVSEGFGLFKK